MVVGKNFFGNASGVMSGKLHPIDEPTKKVDAQYAIHAVILMERLGECIW